MPLQNEMIFAMEIPSLHLHAAVHIPNLSITAPDIPDTTNMLKLQMCYPIALKFN